LTWKRIVLGVVLLAAAGVALGFFWPFGHREQVLRLPGVVEIQEVRLGSKIGGRVEKVLVAEGDTAKPGDVLVTFEAPELKAQLQQAQARLQQAEAQLAKLEAQPRPEEVPVSEAKVRAAEANAAMMEDQYKRSQKLYAREAVGEEEFRQRQLAYAAAQAQLAQAKADLALLKAGAWEPDKASARAIVAEARGKVAEIKANLQEAVVKAPERAIVEVLSVRRGDLITPNQPILRVLRADDLWVKVYVPETELGKLRLNEEVTVTIDAYPGRRFTGTIMKIASESEFTPRNVQSADERRHQVFAVKVHVPDPQGIFKSGMAAEVTVPLQ
jgi:HlyD family secretion protein